MLIIKLNGGLGNQMFQYAFGQALLNAGYDGDIAYDATAFYSNFAHTGFSLEKYFDLKVKLASTEDIKRVFPYGVLTKEYVNYSWLRKKLFFFSNSVKKGRDTILRKKIETEIESEPAYIYDPSLFNLDSQKNIYLSGYFQNAKYYGSVDLTSIFEFKRKLNGKDKELSEKMVNSNSVALHVRRGDYSGTGYDLCSIDYFKNAMTRIPQKNKASFFIFTDDESFVRNNFDFLGNYTICSHSTEDCDYDMQLMAMCKHHIISNSSFSFWGAMLSYSDGVVIAPKSWYNDGNRTYEFELPEDWLKLDN